MANINYLDLLYLGLFALSICSAVTIFRWPELKKRELDLKEYEITVGYNIDESVPQLLGSIIEESFNEYMILNQNFKEDDTINAEKEREIIDGITDYVKDRMSDYILDKLLMYYHEDAIWKVIGEKIYVLVMAFSSNQNGMIEDE